MFASRDLPLRNSRRNLHGPTCQGNTAWKRPDAREGNITPVPHHDVVLIRPREVAEIGFAHRRAVFGIPFRIAHETLRTNFGGPRSEGGASTDPASCTLETRSSTGIGNCMPPFPMLASMPHSAIRLRRARSSWPQQGPRQPYLTPVPRVARQDPRQGRDQALWTHRATCLPGAASGLASRSNVMPARTSTMERCGQVELTRRNQGIVVTQTVCGQIKPDLDLMYAAWFAPSHAAEVACVDLTVLDCPVEPWIARIIRFPSRPLPQDRASHRRVCELPDRT